jgi:hypothetical protein
VARRMTLRRARRVMDTRGRTFDEYVPYFSLSVEHKQGDRLKASSGGDVRKGRLRNRSRFRCVAYLDVVLQCIHCHQEFGFAIGRVRQRPRGGAGSDTAWANQMVKACSSGPSAQEQFTSLQDGEGVGKLGITLLAGRNRVHGNRTYVEERKWRTGCPDPPTLRSCSLLA